MKGQTIPVEIGCDREIFLILGGTCSGVMVDCEQFLFSS